MSIGFFVFEDAMGAELISLLLKHELRVPENVAVLGVDNDDLINSGLTLGLSSVDTDSRGPRQTSGTGAKSLAKQPLERRPPLCYSSKTTGRNHPPKHRLLCVVRNPLVAEALHWIQHHFQRGIQATDVAEAVGITQQGLQKAFKESYIRSPGQEIRYQRAKAVADLLKCTNATLADISKNCGYCSVDTLINGFKAVYACTPGKYRKQNQISLLIYILH